VTRRTDETLPEELREAIELERTWDRLPPQLEERLARRIEHSLVSMAPSIPIETGGLPPGAEVAGPLVVPHGSVAAVGSVATATAKSSVVVGSVATATAKSSVVAGLVATASWKWGLVVAGGLLVGGAGVGTVVSLSAPEPSMQLPRREAPAPAVALIPGPPLPPPSPLQGGEPPVPVPAVVPAPGDSPPPPKPSAASRSEVKRKPAPRPPPEAPALGRDWTLLEAARASNAVGHYGDALSSVTEHSRQYPASQFEQEREALRIQALVGLGRQDEARALARSFEQRFPESILLEGIRQAVGHE
jgi:hypothetical protein